MYPTLRTLGNNAVSGYSTWVHMCYRVHLAGTRVPGAENVRSQFCWRVQCAGTHVPSCFCFLFLSVVEFLKQVAACPGCAGTEDLEKDLNVDDDDPGQQGSPVSSVRSPPGLTAQTLHRQEKQQQQHQQPQHHHHQQQQHRQQPQVPLPLLSQRRRSKVGSVASGVSGGSDKSVMFGYEMADLCELTLEDRLDGIAYKVWAVVEAH